jgi:hypothetical protein
MRDKSRKTVRVKTLKKERDNTLKTARAKA